jgi:hypothetical protein
MGILDSTIKILMQNIRIQAEEGRVGNGINTQKIASP